MEYVESGDPRWAELQRRRAQARAGDSSLELPTWPVYTMEIPDAPSWLGEISRRNGELIAIGFNSGGRGAERGLVVTNQLLALGLIDSLDRALANQFAAVGRDYPVPGALPAGGCGTLPAAPRARAATVRVDGMTASGVFQQEAEFSALRVVVDAVVITAAGRGLDPEGLELDRVTDLTPYRDRVPVVEPSEPLRLNWRSDAQWQCPPDRSQSRWAHRGLLAMTLRSFERHQQSMALNRPHQRLDADWTLWWAAATAQQQDLTGQTRPDAKVAIGDMVNQLNMLGECAPWWSNQTLRERAVNQILWFTTTGDQSLSSAPAQRAWAERADLPLDGALDAWATWAAEQQ